MRDAMGGGPSREGLQQEVRRQGEEIAGLKKRLAEATEFPEQEQQRFAATAAAMGLSYAQTRELLEIVVKKKKFPVGRRSRAG